MFRQLRNRFFQWVLRRIPPQKQYTIGNRHSFVMPTRTGMATLLSTFFLWLLGTNYQNNLVLAVAYFLLALFVASIFLTFFNLVGLTIRYANNQPDFLGKHSYYNFALSRQKRRSHESIQFSWLNEMTAEATPITASLISATQKTIQIPIMLSQRGWQKPGRLYISSVFPFGIIRVWTYLDFDTPILVYPAPIDEDIPLTAHDPDAGETQSRSLSMRGADEFAGLREYIPGDSPRDISWKSLARGQGLSTKQYDDMVTESQWLDFQQLGNLDTETKLSLLCGAAIRFAANPDSEYGLKLPNLTLPPANGEAHFHEVLRALALYRAY